MKSSQRPHGDVGRLRGRALLTGVAALCALAPLTAVAAETAQPPGDTTRLAAASEQLQEVVVTANRLGAEDLQQVPMAITAINADALDRRGLQSLSDITFGTPGITVADVGGGQNTIIIRGISTVGAPDPSNVETQTPVSVYLDDTPISLAGATPDLRLFDLERVEVVRGPQGTLFGAGAMAGNIRYVTRKPNASAYEATLEASGIDTPRGGGGYSVRGMFNAPLVDNLALRVSAYQGQDPGYIDNIARNNGNSNWQTSTQAHAALRFDNQGPLTVDASVLYGRTYRGDAYSNYTYADLPPYEFSATSRESYEDEYTISNITFNYHASSFNVISSSSYVDRNTSGVASAENVVSYFLGYDTLSTSTYGNNIKDFSREIRIATNNWRQFRGQFGVFYENQHRKYVQDFPTEGADAVIGTFYPGLDSLSFGAFNPNDIFSEYQNPDTRQIAEFIELTYSPTNRIDLTAGARQFNWRQSFSLYSGGLFGALDRGNP